MGRSKGGSLLAVGLMSGTSADGVSAALVRIGPGRAVRVLRHLTEPYSRSEQAAILALRDATTSDLSEANFRLGRRFAAAARRVMKGAKPRVIGSHGQTVWHAPGRHTLQIGEPSIIAEETGTDVVADFRTRDIAAGGQGAPLVPFFDDFVFGGTSRRRALLNLGGIANVTLVGGGRPVVAFDTGPGNGLIDDLVRRLTRGRQTFDRGGRLARSGRIDARLLARLLRHPYFRKPPPKSTGRELFGPDFVARIRPSADATATLTIYTAHTIAEAVHRFARPFPAEVIVSGGGVFNDTLMGHLAWLLAPAPVVSSEAYGLPPLAKECAAFALLAARAVQGLPNTIPSATGARRAVSAGKMILGRASSFKL
ncbi:MAG TPA: anhydro-N-acetylmuramic acid kinase [Candidatus Eisenbacteria bacterium]|nr:anhydro-N-acetylmuramic acid kinase [Candidatus Eisenbacteria bacterium]